VDFTADSFGCFILLLDGTKPTLIAF